MRWFRMHADTIANPKIKLLAFEDRWHFVAVCCMKAEGLLDDERDEQLRDRLIATQLGLTVREADEVKRRLSEVDLLLEDWTPKGWDKHQYNSDTSVERTRRYRERKQQLNDVKRHCDVTVTPPDTDTDTETDKKKTARKRATFVKPTVEQVAAYCRERGNSVAPAAFVNHYTANGWKVGKNPMKDWQAAVRTWETRDEKSSGTFGKPVFEQPHERRARELREFAERAEGGSGVDPPAPDVRRPVLEGVWERADRNLDRGD